MAVIKIERQGVQQFEIGDVLFTVDVFEANAKIAQIQDACGEDAVAFYKKMAEMIEGLGGPKGCTGAECVAFNNYVANLAKEKASFFEKIASQPQNTASTSSV